MNCELIKAGFGRQHDWTPIAVEADSLANLECGAIASVLMELAGERRWQLVSLGKFSGLHPDRLPKGALVTSRSSEPIVRELLRLGVPTVRIALDRPPVVDPLLHCVAVDWEANGRMAARHFAERDFKHVAYVGNDPWGEYRAAYEGLADGARQWGCECHLLRVSVRKFRSSVKTESELWRIWQERFMSWMLSLPKPVGLLVESDAAADRSCQWLAEAGLRVPQDVAVLGMGNQSFVCESAPIPISSVAFDAPGFALRAVKLLQELMSSESPERRTIMVPPLGTIARKSTDVLAVSDPKVVEALQYMWDHIIENLSVDQIAQGVSVNRRTLERAFQRELGRGVGQEYQRRRLEKAGELLVQSDMQVRVIADALGFGSRNYFCRAFRTAFNLSPGQYRRAQRKLTAESRA